jgi:SAM-dependent methyltransferase
MLTWPEPPTIQVMTTYLPEVKATQRAGWSSQAQHWYTQVEVTQRQWGVLSDGLLDLARITTGDRVLDLACGVGDPAIAAAHRVGPTGTVIATDLSADMVAFAAQRAVEAGLTNVHTHEMDAEAIDLPPASVDAVLCRLGLMFMPDLDRVFAGVHAVLVPGGRFATAIPWRPEGQAMPRLVGAILAALDLPALPPAAPGTPGIFSLSDAAHVCAALEGAGLTGIRIVPYTIVHDFRTPDEWLDFLLALNVPLRLRLAGVPDDQLDATRATAIAAMAPWVRDDGHVRFPGHGYYATAVR